ncbi:hypothetical protein M5K25_028109 [Dendrobium thyrsiflorum]|uniref:Uncharacterized protein n=1 Tax=Dendrobium thyrsiflorum TaxID=117978 RepID=A0ABD0TVJ4_DENTH
MLMTGREDEALSADANLNVRLGSGMLIAVPIPKEHAAYGHFIESAITRALKEANDKQVTGNAATPFLLSRVNELTGGASLAASILFLIILQTEDIALVKNNAYIGAKIAVALASLRRSSLILRRTMNARPQEEKGWEGAWGSDGVGSRRQCAAAGVVAGVGLPGLAGRRSLGWPSVWSAKKGRREGGSLILRRTLNARPQEEKGWEGAWGSDGVGSRRQCAAAGVVAGVGLPGLAGRRSLGWPSIKFSIEHPLPDKERASPQERGCQEDDLVDSANEKK